MVVAQLVKRSLLIPEVRGSNPDIGKIYNENLFIVNCFEKTKIKKKEHIFLKIKPEVSFPASVATLVTSAQSICQAFITSCVNGGELSIKCTYVRCSEMTKGGEREFR